MNDAEALAMAAQGLVGTPFRFRGRHQKTGVDCIGLVSLALERIGRPIPLLPAYSMRNSDIARLARLATLAGLALTDPPASVGDVVLLRPSAAQYHLAIIGPAGDLIHAHAGLGRVVTSAPLQWTIEARWRLEEI